MNYQVGNTCYWTAEQARQAYVATEQAKLYEFATGCTAVPRFSVTSSGYSVSWTRLSGSCTVPGTVSVSYTPSACAQYGMADAAAMAWGVAACWLCCFAVAVILKRAVQ